MPRIPVPTELKVLRGNPGKKKLNDQEPKPEIKIPDAPGQLGAEATAEWNRISVELAKLGLLSGIDRSALAAYCSAYGRWAEAEMILKHAGALVIKSPKGYPIIHPHIGISNRALLIMHKFLVEFGMTPASRSRIHAKPPSEATEDDVDEYFGTGR